MSDNQKSLGSQLKMSTGVETLLEELQPKLKKYAWKLVAKAKILDHEDVFQELMIAAWRSATKYEEKERPVTMEQWVNTDVFYAGGLLLDRAIKKNIKQRKMLSSIKIMHTESFDQIALLDQMMDLEEVLKRSDEKSCRAFQLKFQGFSAEEIAEKLQVSRMQVYNLIHSITDKVDA